MLTLIGYICLFSASIIYNLCFASSEVRTMMILACFINLFGAVTSYLFVRDILFGMNPYVFVCATTTVSEVLYNAIVTLPS